MSNKISKIRAKCMEAIKNKPGILRSEMGYMDIGHRSNIGIQVSRLVYDGSVVRVWDETMLSWRLYPKGKEPHHNEPKAYKKSLYSKGDATPIFKDAHGDKFYMAFDEAYRLLYIDLKILGMAVQRLGNTI